MTRLTLTLLAVTFLTTLSTAAHAEDRPDHYKGEPSETLEIVHKASENVDADATLSKGREYLSVSRQLIK